MEKRTIKQNENDIFLPEVYAEMNMVFENDFDVYMVTKEIGIKPSECKRRRETRINSLTKEHNPGFWTIKSKVFCEYDVDKALDDLLSIFKDNIFAIKEICEKNNGKIIFYIVATFYYNDQVALDLNRKFLEVVEALEAEVRFDLYIEKPPILSRLKNRLRRNLAVVGKFLFKSKRGVNC